MTDYDVFCLIHISMFAFTAGNWHVHLMGATLVAIVQLAYCCRNEAEICSLHAWDVGLLAPA